MEENNQNIQVEQNENGGINNQMKSANVQKPSKMALIVCTIVCAVFVGVSLIYFIESLNFEGLEGLALIVTLPIILGSNVLASVVSIVNFIIAFKKSKGQRIFALILMILVILYSVISIVVFHIQ